MVYSIITVPKNEWLTGFEAEQLVRRDYCAFVVNDCNLKPESFVQDNLLAYWLLSNTWCLLAQDLGGPGLAALLKLEIIESGLTETIKRAAVEADSLIRYYHTNRTLQRSDVAQSGRFFSETWNLPLKEARQVLVYGKRFAPVVKARYSKLASKSVEGFLEVNKEGRVYAERFTEFMSVPQTGANHDWKVAWMCARRVIKELVKDFPGWNRDSFPRMGPGAARHTANPSPYAKYEFMVRTGQYRPEYPIFVLPPEAHPDTVPRTVGKRQMKPLAPADKALGSGETPQIARISTVPKKVTANRIVAPESPENMSKQLYLKDILEQRIADSQYDNQIPIHNQTKQQERARFAVFTNRDATIDLSHASDSVLKVHVQWLFPDDWWNAFRRCIPFSFIMTEKDQRPRRLHAFATMGCGCTFVVEAIVFFALCSGFYMMKGWKSGKYTLSDLVANRPIIPYTISAYGDDCLIPSWMLEEFSEFLEYFGFMVNHDKTFANGYFRESCGTDWVSPAPGQTEDISAVYWPRIPLRGYWSDYISGTYQHWSQGNNAIRGTMTKLVALQHNLWSVSKRAAEFLAQAIRSYQPYATSSRPEEELDDLWETKPRRSYCYFVGVNPNDDADIDAEMRRIGPFEYLPAGYVREDAYPLWCRLHGIDGSTEASQQHLRKRRYKVRFAVRKAYVPKTEYYTQVLDEMQAEIIIRRLQEPRTTSLCTVTIVDQHSANETDLAELHHCGHDALDAQALLGVYEGYTTFDIV